MEQDDIHLDEYPDQFIDTTHLFISNKRFADRSTLISEIQEMGLLHNIQIRVAQHHSDRGLGEQWFRCEQGGRYQRRTKLNVSSSRSYTATKRIGCPFKLKCLKQSDGAWTMNVHNGNHNHYLVEKAPPLSVETKESISRMTESKIGVSNIVIDFGSRNIKLKRKQVYNVRAKLRNKSKEYRTASEQLLKLATDHGYRTFHQTIPSKQKGKSELTDVLFANPDSINLLKRYPYILIADTTYNTNMYKMPLLEVIGVTPVHKNFSIFYAFLQNEKETAYDWALKCIKEVVASDERIVFVTDKESALINAIELHFPSASLLLCRRHIEKDVGAWVKKRTGNGLLGDCFAQGKWTQMVRSTTEEEFIENEKLLFSTFKKIGGLEDYCRKTWLTKYKKRFVSAWTNEVLHFGNVTTNRVESAHASLKRILRTSVGGFDTVFETIHESVARQIQEIKFELAESLTKTLHVGRAIIDSLRLGNESPLPIMHPIWKWHVDASRRGDYDIIKTRVELYKSFLPKQMPSPTRIIE